MKKFWILVWLILILSSINCLGQNTQFDMTTQLKQWSSTTPAHDGVIPIWSQSTSQYVPGDPLVTVADLTQALSITGTTCTGTPPSGTGCQLIVMQGKQSVSVAFPSATWTGTIVFEVSIDGVNYIGTDVWDESNEQWTSSFVCAGTCSGNFWFEGLGAISAARVRATSWSSGTATGTLLATNQPIHTFEFQASDGKNFPSNGVGILGKDPGGLGRGILVNKLGNPKTVLGGKATYKVNSGTITGATSTGVKSLAYLWHPSSVTLRYELVGCNVNQIAGVGGAQRIELNRITAENGTPGGTTGTLLTVDQDDAASGATFRIAPTGAPTRQSGVYDGGDFTVTINGNAFFPSVSTQLAMGTKPLVARASQNEGWEIVQNVITAITTAPTFNVSCTWTESAE